MSELFRSVGLLSVQRIVLLVLGALRTKIAATLLGPGGMGLVAQAIGFRDLLQAGATLGMRNAYLKLVAEYRGRGDHHSLEVLLVSAVGVTGGLSLVIAAVVMIAAPEISSWIFGDGSHATLARWSAVVVIFAVPGALFTRTFAGSLDYRSYVQIAVSGGVVGVVAMALLAWWFGVPGAMASFALAEAAVLVLAAVLLRRRIARPLGLDLRPRRPDGRTLRRLARLAGALSLSSFAATGAVLVVRAEIIRRFGSDENGYYQVAWQVGQNYLGILGVSLWGYGMPKVATRLDDPEAVVALQNDFLRICLALLAPGVILLLVTREIWITILFTEAFLAAGTMACWQLLGELAAMVRQSMNISLLPRERLGFLVLQAYLYWGLWVAFSWIGMPWLGAEAAAVGYLAANVVALLVTYVYHRRVLGYRMTRENRRLLGWGLPAIVTAFVLALGDALVLARVVSALLAVACLYVNRASLRRVWRG